MNDKFYEPGAAAKNMLPLADYRVAELRRRFTDSYIYLASPYSHPDPVMMVARYEAATREAGRWMANGWNIFSPIAHSHVVAERTELPKSWDYWKGVDEVFLRQAGAVFVYMLDGWGRSTGVQAEIAMAKKMGKPVYYLFHNVGLVVEGV